MVEKNKKEVKRINKTYNELTNDLNNQIHCIEDSIDSYLLGKSYEAPRVAVALRTLLHDTKNSTSLLSLLQIKRGLYFFDNATPYETTNLLNSNLLLDMHLSAERGGFMPRLKADIEEKKWKKFQDWWEQPVITYNTNHNYYTRKDVILYLADKEGGAHFDEKIEEDYYKITRENAQNWEVGIGNQVYAIGNDCFEKTVISIAYEVLTSLYHQLDRNRVFIRSIKAE